MFLDRIFHVGNCLDFAWRVALVGQCQSANFVRSFARLGRDLPGTSSQFVSINHHHHHREQCLPPLRTSMIALLGTKDLEAELSVFALQVFHHLFSLACLLEH